MKVDMSESIGRECQAGLFCLDEGFGSCIEAIRSATLVICCRCSRGHTARSLKKRKKDLRHPLPETRGRDLAKVVSLGKCAS